MKALSIKQPWAWLICRGLKDIENRTWSTPFRGRIYVHAGASVDQLAIPIRDPRLYGGIEHGAFISREDTKCMMDEAIYPKGEIWKVGAIISEVDIIDCVTCSTSRWFDGPYGFVLANPMLYERAIPYKGRLGFFEVVFPEK